MTSNLDWGLKSFGTLTQIECQFTAYAVDVVHIAVYNKCPPPPQYYSCQGEKASETAL